MGRTAITWLADRLLDISALLLLIMMVHVCADVGMKYIFNRPIQGTLEVVSYYYMVWAVFLPLALIEMTRSAVSVELFFNMFPRPMQVICIALVLLACAVTYAGLSWITLLDALRSFSRSEVVMGPVTVAIWPSRFILPISFALAGFVCLWHLVRITVSSEARAELIASPSSDEGPV
ncbi:TRAP transporter small permease [Seohaeicola saemankumensis]|uniref:TRAP transporter small permease subunit n=1 Tax=Seohaeicola saemankumensis TaxID=481181 RepID=UPI0035D0E1E8